MRLTARYPALFDKPLSARADWVTSPLVLLMVSAVVIFGSGSQLGRTPFLGDDLETWANMQSGRYPKTAQEALVFAGSEKWRPINTLVMTRVLSIFGDNYQPYWFLSSFLILVVVWLVIRAAHSLFEIKRFRARLAIWIGAILIASSPFTFMARSGIYGFLEIAPLVLSLCAYLTLSEASTTGRRTPLVYGSLLALLAGLIHERFYAFSVAMALICAIRSRRERQFSGMWLTFAGNLFLYVYTSVIVLRVNVLRGGGEEPLNESFGSWVLVRIIHALLKLLGGSGGETTYFDTTRPNVLYQGLKLRDEYTILIPLILGIFLVMVPLILQLVFRIRMDRSGFRGCGRSYEQKRRSGVVLELLLVSFALLIPAATVISRVESRWLFAPLVFLVVALVGLAEIQDFSGRGALVALALLLVGNVLHRNSFAEFDWWRIRTIRVLTTVQSLAPENGYWEVGILVPGWPDRDDNNAVLKWALNDGNALLRYIDNAPNAIYFGSPDSPEVARTCQRPCLLVTVFDDPSQRSEIDMPNNQKITYRWLS